MVSHRAWWAWHRFGWWAGIFWIVALMAIWVVFAVRGDESRIGRSTGVTELTRRSRSWEPVCRVWTARIRAPGSCWQSSCFITWFSAGRLEWLWFWQPWWFWNFRSCVVCLGRQSGIMTEKAIHQRLCAIGMTLAVSGFVKASGRSVQVVRKVYRIVLTDLAKVGASPILRAFAGNHAVCFSPYVSARRIRACKPESRFRPCRVDAHPVPVWYHHLLSGSVVTTKTVSNYDPDHQGRIHDVQQRQGCYSHGRDRSVAVWQRRQLPWLSDLAEYAVGL